MRALAVVLGSLALLATAGCTPDIPDGRFQCTVDADCPPGFGCRSNRCFAGQGGVDAATDAASDAASDAALDAGRDSAVDAAIDARQSDVGPHACAVDADCSNGTFCDGVERCDPTATGADPITGCAAPTAVACLPSQTCDEATDHCTSDCATSGDADHDGHDSVDCAGDDCDDANGNVFPGHAETCDAVDNDCNPATFGTTDLDSDGSVSNACCNPGAGGPICGPDCDDASDTVGSGDVEACDGLDNDCNGTIDDGVLTTFYRDVDGDLYGQASMTMQACVAPTGYAAMSGDCDDSMASVHPGVPETCNAIDDDCSGAVDDGVTCTCTNGTMQDCGSMVGICTTGRQTCVGGTWGACMGGTGPGAELCNGLDDDCDTMPDDGAAANCATRPNTTPSCSSAACRYACTPSFQTCDTIDPGDATGCESNGMTDVAHCGGCTACGTPTNVATRACVGGACAVVTCSGRFADCDGMFSTGCERAIDTVTDCGGCSMACPLRPSSTPVCLGTACSFTCNSGASDCDGNAVNGCETALASCDAAPPRLVGPLTAMVVTSNRPQLRFAPVAGTTMARIDVCSDPACATVVWSGTGTSPVTVGTSLSPGRYYWRAYALVGTTVGSVASPTWNFVTFSQTTTAVSADAFPLLNVAGGIDDFAIGEPSTSGGRVVFYDSATTTMTQTLNAPASRNGFGSSISSVDVNGDGYVDLLVGACMADVTSATAPTVSTGCSGYVVVYQGDATGRFNTTPLFTVGTGNGSGRVGFGYSVSGVGDFNGDGFGDFVVGAYSSNAAFVYLGRATGAPTEVDLTFGSGTSRFGWAVAGAGDVDGDHLDDVLIGAYNAFTGGSFSARVVFGIASGAPAIDDLVGPGPGLVTGLGDVNGDGRADIAIGTSSGLGSVSVYPGSATRSTIGNAGSRLWTLSGTASMGYGASLLGPGDVDGDGVGDVAVGATGTKEMYLYSGSTGSLIWSASDSGMAFGRTLGRGGLLGGSAASIAVATCGIGGATCTAEVTLWNGAARSLRGIWSGTVPALFGAGLAH